MCLRNVCQRGTFETFQTFSKMSQLIGFWKVMSKSFLWSSSRVFLLAASHIYNQKKITLTCLVCYLTYTTMIPFREEKKICFSSSSWIILNTEWFKLLKPHIGLCLGHLFKGFYQHLKLNLMCELCTRQSKQASKKQVGLVIAVWLYFLRRYEKGVLNYSLNLVKYL